MTLLASTPEIPQKGNDKNTSIGAPSMLNESLPTTTGNTTGQPHSIGNPMMSSTENDSVHQFAATDSGFAQGYNRYMYQTKDVPLSAKVN